MSVTQTYYLAHKARAKLSHEAARADHSLRLLVGHANLLDSLMLELADAEREQESWFNQSVRGASAAAAPEAKPDADRHVKWADDAAVEEPGEDWRAEDADDSDDSESDSDSELGDDEDVGMADVVSLRRVSAGTVEYADEEDEEDYSGLALTRSPSHPASPPELDLDHGDDSSEDESLPSPPSAPMPSFSDRQKASIATSGFYDAPPDEKGHFYEDTIYLPARNPARLISAISVY
jgi:hypothetical protein